MKVIFAVILIFAQFSCTKIVKREGSKFMRESLTNVKTKLPLHLTNHFPYNSISDSSKLVSKFTQSEGNISIYFFEYLASEEKIDSLMEILYAKKIAQYDSFDSCMFFPHVDLVSQDGVDIDSCALLSRCTIIKSFAIPKFRNFCKDDSVKKHGNELFEIFVLDSKNIKIDSSLISDESRPSHWTNGYSLGVAINEQKHIIIYWTLAW